MAHLCTPGIAIRRGGATESDRVRELLPDAMPAVAVGSALLCDIVLGRPVPVFWPGGDFRSNASYLFGPKFRWDIAFPQ